MSPPCLEGSSSEQGMESIFEDYKIVGQIGEGGVGTVWRAVQLSTHRQVALKMLGRGSFVSKKARMRFEREVELTARLEHANIARIYDSGIHRSMYYYTMELFEGEHLDRYVRIGRFSQRQIIELMYLVCQAVQYAHQRGVIHRDLKPSNIIVTEDGQPHIVDFGLAKTFLEGDKTVTVSLDGDVAGTPAYMSPEQARGDMDAIDTRTDVYSLGVILFNVLTNDWPYDISGSHYEVLKNIQEQEPQRPSKLVSHMDSDIEAILLKVLSKDPSQRYQSAGEMAHDMDCWLKGLAISARSVDTLYLLRKLIVRHRKTSIIAGLLLVILLSTSFISVFYYYQKSNIRKQLQAEQDTKRSAQMHVSQVAFAMFLQLWHDHRDIESEGLATTFDTDSKEKKAARFLLDARSLNEKMADYQQDFAGYESGFWYGILGEYHIRSDDKPSAVEAYRKCLSLMKGNVDPEDRFMYRVKSKLEMLLNENMSPESKPNISVGG